MKDVSGRRAKASWKRSPGLSYCRCKGFITDDIPGNNNLPSGRNIEKPAFLGCGKA
jgi:hypothetical protein